MRVTIITYDKPHLKTEQILQSLSLDQDLELSLLVVPFKERKKRTVLFRHRPDMLQGMDYKDLSLCYNVPVQKIFSFKERIKFNPDYVIVGGAGIIDQGYPSLYKIINVHPGLIPAARGLDSFKWSILNNLPLGITLHVIDDIIDAGKVIYRVKTPILENDSLESLAKRHYNLEISVIGHFRTLLKSKDTDLCIPAMEANRRMPIDKERLVIDQFDNYKKIMQLSSGRFCS